MNNPLIKLTDIIDQLGTLSVLAARERAVETAKGLIALRTSLMGQQWKLPKVESPEARERRFLRRRLKALGG